MPILKHTNALGTREVLIPNGVQVDIIKDEDTPFGKQTFLIVRGTDENAGGVWVNGSTKEVRKQLNL